MEVYDRERGKLIREMCNMIIGRVGWDIGSRLSIRMDEVMDWLIIGLILYSEIELKGCFAFSGVGEGVPGLRRHISSSVIS